MKFLFDENLGTSLPRRLTDIAPDSSHVNFLNLQAAQDSDIWKYAKERGFIIFSKDVDMHDLSLIYGAPPKVIWIRLGNCSTQQVEDHFRRNVDLLSLFHLDDSVSLLPLP